MKKTFCAFLAIVMCMALAIPVFAGNNAGDAGDSVASGTQYTGRVTTATIQVSAPTAQTVMLNPYRIKIEKTSVLSSGGSGQISPSVITPTLVLKNESNVPLKLTLTVTGEIPTTGTPASTAKFLTAKPDTTEKNHGVFMYVDVQNKGSKAVADAPTAADVLAAGKAADYDTSKVYSDTNKTGTQCVVKAGAVKMTDFMTLAVPAENQAGYVTIDIGGTCAPSPTSPWAATDTVNVNFAFTFTAKNNAGT